MTIPNYTLLGVKISEIQTPTLFLGIVSQMVIIDLFLAFTPMDSLLESLLLFLMLLRLGLLVR